MSPAGRRQPAAAQRAAYVYGVGRLPPDGAPASLELDGIIPGAPVEPLVHGDLVAFLSQVPAMPFGADVLGSKPGAEWVRDRVVAHERILERLCSDGDVVPFRFATIFHDRDAVLDILGRRRSELEHALDRVCDAAEWGVKLYCHDERLRRRLEAAPGGIANLRQTLTEASPGAQFFLRKKYARALDEAAVSRVELWVERARLSLEPLAREAVEVAMQTSAEHGRSETMVMNMAYLVPHGAFVQFRQTLATLRNEFAAEGFEDELTGPWPAYHFVSTPREGGENATTAVG
ncbi:MAG: GvpL/GvpF family gas vesicle protein [Devosia sp.]|nr:GvpL/GvpF family gas vesicle protein [Devosia sp.]